MLLDTVIRSLAGRPSTSESTSQKSTILTIPCKSAFFLADARYPHAANRLFIHTINQLIDSPHTERVIVWSLRNSPTKLKQSLSNSTNQSKLTIIDSVSQSFTAPYDEKTLFLPISNEINQYITSRTAISQLSKLVSALQQVIDQLPVQSADSPSKSTVLCIDGLSQFMLHNQSINQSVDLIHFIHKLTLLKSNDRSVHLSIHIDHPCIDQLSSEHLNALNRVANTIITCESVRLVPRPVQHGINQSINQSINVDRVLTIHISHNRKAEKRSEKFEQWLVQPDGQLTAHETNTSINQSINQSSDRMDAAINSLVDASKPSQPDVQSTFSLGMSSRQRAVKQAIAIAQEQRSDSAISLTASGLSINQSVMQINTDSLIEADDLLDDDEEDPDDDLDI